MNSLAGKQVLRRDESVVSADVALDGKKIIAFYFSAHWCPPCRLFTPVLAEFYSVSSNRITMRICQRFLQPPSPPWLRKSVKMDRPQELVGAGEPFEVVFVSSDKSAEELMAYMKVRFKMTAIHYIVHLHLHRDQIHGDCFMEHSGFGFWKRCVNLSWRN